MIIYDADADCWRWKVELPVDGNTRIVVSGETVTRGKARVQERRWSRLDVDAMQEVKGDEIRSRAGDGVVRRVRG